MTDKAATPADAPAPQDVEALHKGRHGDPFSVLGPHVVGGTRQVRAVVPTADSVAAVTDDGTEHSLARLSEGMVVFAGAVPGTGHYWLRARADDRVWEFEDPYSFGPVIGETDEYLLAEGTHQRLWTVLGAHVMQHEGQHGTHFAVWAPNAQRVSVVGPFNTWDGRRNPMRRRGGSGVWEIFLPNIGEGEVYKYEIIGPGGEMQPLKSDPVGFGSQHPPENASVVRHILGYGWKDDAWMADRAGKQSRTAPISVYEVHLGSWKRYPSQGNRPISYREAAEELIEYVHHMGYTHIELLPISEFPFDGSWGYQPVGLFAPSIRFGPPHEFRDLVEAAHARGVGVIMDWVPGHFPEDPHGLAKFDGTRLYEYADPREGYHQDWNTLIYDYGRTEVSNFLASNALYWLDEYHVDGLRVDAVASMLYRDYSRNDGEWIPNKDGGRENYEAIATLQKVNTVTYGEAPGIITVAEESTSYPQVSRPVDQGGLGFGFKWNMGWMNDTLSYMATDPYYRKHSHHKMTFGIHYAFSENFVLPISHDEVVHGKGSMIGKMPGDETQKFANLRAYYGFMWGHPGKKLLFMGQDFAQPTEWNYNAQLPWELLDDPKHGGVSRLVQDLNTLYRAEPALHALDCDPNGFQWIEADDADRSVYAWIRRSGGPDPEAVVVSNFTPVERDAYDMGFPSAGRWREALNTDAARYNGGDRGNMGGVTAREVPLNGQAASARVVVPPLSTVIFVKDA